MSDEDARKRERTWTAFLFVAALLPRLYVAIAWAREPVWDGHYYDFGARQLASGHGYGDETLIDGAMRFHPWCHYPVGYSGLLAGAYFLFGTGSKIAPIVNAVLGAGLVAIVHRLGLLTLTPIRARIAAVLVAVSPELIVYSALLMTEPAASIAPILAAYLVLRFRSRHAYLGVVAAGIVLGLGTLVRPQTVLGAPALFFLVIDPARIIQTSRRAFAIAAVGTLACLATVAPWTARNCAVMDGCAFVSTNAGWNLAIGSFPRATGRFETLRATDGCPVVTGQAQQDRCWMKLGLESIESSPARFLSLIPKKLSFTYDHASFPMGYLGEADRERFTEPVKAEGRALLTTTHRAYLAFAIFAMVAAWWKLEGAAEQVQAALFAVVLVLLTWTLSQGEPKPFWIVAVCTPIVAFLPLPGRPPLGPALRYLVLTYAAVTLTHAIFFGEDRYHVFVTPILALLCAAMFRTLSSIPSEPPREDPSPRSP